MLDARSWLNLELAAVLLVAILLSACVAGPYVGPSTVRCTGGAEVIHYDPDYVKYTCGEELVVTGSLSDNGASFLTNAIAAITGWLVAQ